MVHLYLLKNEVDPQQQNTNECHPESQHSVEEIVVRQVYERLQISQGNEQPCQHEPRKTVDPQSPNPVIQTGGGDPGLLLVVDDIRRLLSMSLAFLSLSL